MGIEMAVRQMNGGFVVRFRFLQLPQLFIRQTRVVMCRAGIVVQRQRFLIQRYGFLKATLFGNH